MDYERKICTMADLKVLDEGSGVLEGYASVYGVVDRANERTMPGCFDGKLSNFVDNGFISWGHDWNVPVGSIESAGSDVVGFKVRSSFHSTPAAQEARQWVKERRERGKTVGLSIGYKTLKSMEAEDGVRDLTELELYEVAIVTVPCLPSAQVTSAKSGQSLDDHSETVLATVREFAGRVQSLSELRSKEGRTLSDANRDRLRSHMDALAVCVKDMESLLAERPELSESAEVQAAIKRYAQTMGRLAGYPVTPHLHP